MSAADAQDAVLRSALYACSGETARMWRRRDRPLCARHQNELNRLVYLAARGDADDGFVALTEVVS